MGLAIEVGYLADMLQNDEEGAQWFRRDLATLNQYLPSRGLPPHQEPETCPVFSVSMLGYSGLHYLRRIAAHLDKTGALPPPGDVNAPKDPVLEQYSARAQVSEPSTWLGRLFGGGSGSASPPSATSGRFDHLILHSDCEGFYLPQDFPNVLFPPERLSISGLMIGSSVRLKAELEQLAAVLSLPLHLDPGDDEVFEATGSQGAGDALWKRYACESHACLSLHHAAVHSIRHSSVIVFC